MCQCAAIARRLVHSMGGRIIMFSGNRLIPSIIVPESAKNKLEVYIHHSENVICVTMDDLLRSQ